MNIEELEFEELNELAHESGDFEHIVKWELDEFFEMLSECNYDPQDIANMIYFGGYSPFDDYAGFDGDGNIETMSKEQYEEEIEALKEELEEYL